MGNHHNYFVIPNTSIVILSILFILSPQTTIALELVLDNEGDPVTKCPGTTFQSYFMVSAGPSIAVSVSGGLYPFPNPTTSYCPEFVIHLQYNDGYAVYIEPEEGHCEPIYEGGKIQLRFAKTSDLCNTFPDVWGYREGDNGNEGDGFIDTGADYNEYRFKIQKYGNNSYTVLYCSPESDFELAAVTGDDGGLKGIADENCKQLDTGLIAVSPNYYTTLVPMDKPLRNGGFVFKKNRDGCPLSW